MQLIIRFLWRLCTRYSMTGPCLDIHGFPRVLRDGEGARVRVIKVRPRLARPSNSWALSRDTVGALNIGLRALAPGGRGLASPSTEPHVVWAKLVIPC